MGTDWENVLSEKKTTWCLYTQGRIQHGTLKGVKAVMHHEIVNRIGRSSQSEEVAKQCALVEINIQRLQK